MSRRMLWVVALVIVFLFGLALAVLAQGPGADASRPIRLTENAPQRQVLPGNPAGRFAYYTFDYPGAGRPVTVEVSILPGEPILFMGTRVNLYGRQGLLAKGRGAADKPGAHRIVYHSDISEPWLIQIANYMQRTVVYEIRVFGLGASRAPTPAPMATAQPVQARGVGPLGAGTLVGNGGGAFATHSFDYAGDGSAVTLWLSFTPDDPSTSRRIGFNIYGPQGQVKVANIIEPGVRRVTFIPTQAGSYTVQVYNYAEGLPVQYTLSRR